MPSPSLESALVRILSNEQEPRQPVGAGFLVTSQHILTSAQVVNATLGRRPGAADRPEGEISLDFPLLSKHSLFRAKILHWFPVQEDAGDGRPQDLAVLELVPETPLPNEVGPIPVVVPEEQAFFGQRVRMYGFPRSGERGSWTHGLLQGLTIGGLVEIRCRDVFSPATDELSQRIRRYSRKELGDQWELLTEKLSRLEKDHILETRPEERLRLEYKIKETQAERDAVEQRLRELEGQQGDKGAEAGAAPQNNGDRSSDFSGSPVWAVAENAVCGMIVQRFERENGTAFAMLPAALLMQAFPELEQLSRPANPYRGLEAFREQDAHFFFGREETVVRLQRTVEEQPFVAVIGASGSGKSSLVSAGLVPALLQGGNWLTSRCLPRKQPFYELAACLVPFLYEDPILRSEKTDELRAKFAAGTVSLSSIVRLIREQQEGRRLLLIIDQFEELFTLNTDRDLIQAYLTCLHEGAQAGEVTVLIAMRADFLEPAIGYALAAWVLDTYPPVILPQMEEQGLREVIERPAALPGVSFAEGLIDLIIRDLGNEPGNLPLLEFCLTQLWERQESRQISHAAYRAVGGVQQALANHAEAVYAEFAEADQERLRQIFLKLVRPGQGTEDTRQVASLEQIRAEDRAVVTRLADRRLVVTSRHEEQDTVEVVHEALIRRWGTLRQWVNEEREFLVWQEKLWVLLRQWQDSGQDEGALLRGLPLDEALKWRGTHDIHLAIGERKFIGASEWLRERERQKKDREKKEREVEREAVRLANERRKRYLAVALVFTVISVAISGWQLIVTRFSLENTMNNVMILQAKLAKLHAGIRSLNNIHPAVQELYSIYESVDEHPLLKSEARAKAYNLTQQLLAIDDTGMEINYKIVKYSCSDIK